MFATRTSTYTATNTNSVESEAPNLDGSRLAFVLVVAGFYEVEYDVSPRAVHLVFVVVAQVVVFTRHQPLRRVRGAVRATHDRHLLDALAHV